VGGAADRDIGPPHPALSPRPAGGEGRASGYGNPLQTRKLTAHLDEESPPMRGHPGLREYADAHTRVLRGRHMTLNHLYEINGDHATGRATTVVSIATKSGFKIMGQGPTRTGSSRPMASGKSAIVGWSMITWCRTQP
jgi:hypothetical protein